MACREIVELSYIEAKEYACDAGWACISIASTEKEFSPIHKSHRQGLLQLAFADSDKPLPGFIHF